MKVASVLDAEFDDASADVTLKWYVVAHDNPDTINECAVTNAALEILAPYDAVAPEGPEAIFLEKDLDRLFETIGRLASVD